MENISLTELYRLFASFCAVVISTPIMGRVRARSQPWGLGVRPMVLSIGVRLRACALLLLRSGANVREALAWNVFGTCLWPTRGKERILDNLPFKRSWAELKCVFAPRKIENEENRDRLFSVLVLCLLTFFFSVSWRKRCRF